jgi:hypothetical protein
MKDLSARMSPWDWLRCGRPEPMLHFLRELGVQRRPSGRRRLRLFACACARRRWPLLSDPRSRALIETAERYADGLAGRRELAAAERSAQEASEGLVMVGPVVRLPHRFTICYQVSMTTSPQPAWEAALVATLAPVVAARSLAEQAGEQRAQADLLRDLFGDPYQPCRFDPHWRAPEVLALARAGYEGPDATALPILADALEEAGCTNEALLTHLRGPGPHARGCWAVDAVLGKGAGAARRGLAGRPVAA